MSTLYYVTAVAPAAFYVGGRQRQLLPGDSQGPFTEAELAQIMTSPDRRKLVTTTSIGNSPKVTPPSQKQVPFSEAPAPEVPTPSPEEVVFPSQEAIFQELVEEPLVTPVDDVPAPLTIPEAQKLEEPVVGEVLAEPNTELIYSSFSQPLPEVSDFTAEEIPTPQEEEQVSEAVQEPVEGEEDLSPRARRRRRQA